MSIVADINYPPHGDRTRDAALDAARGIAMIMVVFGHALDGAQSAGHASDVTRFLLILVYTTHIPLFLIVSGVLSEALCARPWRAFLHLLGLRVVWPYLLWSFTLLTLQYGMGNYTNGVLQNYRPLSILWDAPGVLWYLYVLCIALILHKLLMPAPRQMVFILGLACLIAPYSLDDWPTKSRFIGIFLIGSAFGPRLFRIALHPRTILAASCIVVATIWIAFSRADDPIAGYPAYQAVFIPAIFAGPVLVYAFSQRFVPSGGDTLLNLIGRNTMAIFVTHILFTAGTRIVMVHLGVTDWTLIIATATCAGIAMPLMAAVMARRWGFSKVLGWQ